MAHKAHFQMTRALKDYCVLKYYIIPARNSSVKSKVVTSDDIPVRGMGSCLGWLQVHKINGLKICKSKELRVCCTHSPKNPGKKCLDFLGSVSWMWSAVCAPHIIDGSEMNNGQKMNNLKYFYMFKLTHLAFWLEPRSFGLEIIPTNPFHLVASCNPVEKRVLICKPRPPGLNNTS